MSVYLYEGRLLETPDITKSSPDEYWGIEEINDVTLEFDNTDGYFITKIVAEEIRDKLVILKRWDENESGSNKLVFEMMGKISSYEISDKARITVSSAIKDKLNKYYPAKVYQLTDFTETRPNIYNPPDDLGKPYPIIFGRCEKVPCIYIHCDYTNDYYDYAVSYVGPGQSLKSCQAVYRDGVKVATSEYTFYDGSQTTPYPGYAFLRFTKEQRSFSGSMHQISGDFYGLTLGGSDECRNFATVIENFLSNSNWGCSEGINGASFTAAAAILDAIGSYYCDGAIYEQRTGRDILNDLLLGARGKLKYNDSGEWTITIDDTDTDKRAYFGSGDGVWENILPGIKYYKTAVEESLKKVILRYKFDPLQGDYAYKYERTVMDFGEEREYICNFIRDHTTGDKLACYLQRRALYRDSHLEMTVGMEGRFLNEMDLLDIQIPRYQIEADYKIRRIKKRAGQYDLELVSHNNLIYTYSAGTLNTDPVPNDPPDYDNPDAPDYEAPQTPVSIAGINPWTFIVANTGEVTARLVAKMFKHPDDINFAYCMVGTRMYGETEYKWQRAYEYDHATNEWRVVIYMPASTYPGGGAFEGSGGAYLYFDAAVKSVNTFGRDSALKTFSHEQIPYKDVAPTNSFSSITTSNAVKIITWSWAASTLVDLKDYHIQIDDDSGFGSPLIDVYTKNNNFTYATSLAYGATIYFRVRVRNTTLIEAAAYVSTSSTVTATLPDDSVSRAAIASDVPGVGMSQAAGGELDVNYDNSTIGINGSDQLYVKADGITETQIQFGSTATGASAGADTLPANPIGFINVDVGGTTRRVPYYGT